MYPVKQYSTEDLIDRYLRSVRIINNNENPLLVRLAREQYEELEPEINLRAENGDEEALRFFDEQDNLDQRYYGEEFEGDADDEEEDEDDEEAD